MLQDLHTGAETLATSAGIPFPSQSIADWAEAGGEGTVGELIAEELGCDKQDPHVKISKGLFTRAALLEQAIRLAASTMPS